MEKNTTITIRISETEKEALRAIAGKLDVSMAQVIRQAVKEFIKENEG